MKLKQFRNTQFEMKDLGCLVYFIGLEVSSDQTCYYLSKAKYFIDILSRVRLTTDNKTTNTPLEINVKLLQIEGTIFNDPTLYRKLVGSLIYLTATHPDIAYVVHIVSKFMTFPNTTHFAVVLRILRYIKGMLFYGLHFSTQSLLTLCAYCKTIYHWLLFLLRSFSYLLAK